MRYSKISLLFLVGCFGGMVGAMNAADGLRGSDLAEQRGRQLTNLMMPGARVSAIDREGAICSADQTPNQDADITATVITYYYAIESSSEFISDNSKGRAIIRTLEDKLFRAIRPAILWCYFDEQDSRRLSLEDARRLSIVSFSNSPEDEQLKAFDCNFETSDAHCIVMEGRISIMHHETSDVSLAVASLYDSMEKAMDFSDIFFDIGKDDKLGSITNIQWIGENEEDIFPIEETTIAPTPIATVEVTSQSTEEKRSFLAYALSIPILLVLASLLFLGKKKVKRKLVTQNEFAWAMYDDVMIGTGDHPNSFHEGMYHYSQYGIRYLSTNCRTCIETKRNGFFTEDDLETISEESVDTSDLSAYRKRHLVNASSTDLGAKHSSIDVHQCSSARCHICMYRPQNVEFSNCQPCTDVEFVSKLADVQEEEITFYKEQRIRAGESEV